MNNRTFIILGISVLAALVACGGVVFLYRTIESTKVFVRAARLEIQEARALEDNVQTLRRSLRTTEEAQARLDAYFIEPEETVAFIESIEAIGVQIGTPVEIESVHDSKDEQSRALVLSLSAQGTFEQVRRLVTALEHMPYEIKMESVFLNAETDTESKRIGSMFQAVITLRLMSYTQ